MIEVISYSNNEKVDSAECDTPEEAISAARTLWDEAFNGIQGQKRAIMFIVDGRLIRRIEARP